MSSLVVAASLLSAVAASAQESLPPLDVRQLWSEAGQDRPYTGPVSRERIERASTVFIDFTRSELDLFIGIMSFSSEYEADPEPCMGLLWRAPLPLVAGGVGLFVELAIMDLERDIDVLPDNDGEYFIAGAGLDYTVARGEKLFVRVMAGGIYGNYRRLSDTEDGFGGIFGAIGGIRISTGVWLTYSPQYIMVDDGEWNFMNSLGMNFEL